MLVFKLGGNCAAFAGVTQNNSGVGSFANLEPCPYSKLAKEQDCLHHD